MLTQAPARTGRARAAVLVTVATAALLVGVAYGLGRDAGPPAERRAPSFSLPSVSGDGTVSLEQRGGSPAVVNFFASWCAPCRRELPHFAEAAERHEGEVVFLGVAHQDDAELAAEMLAEHGVEYPAGNDPDGNVARDYGLRGMPSTAFVAGDGQLIGLFSGELDAEGLRGWIEKLLAA